MAAQTVWVMVRGTYSDKYVAGVFTTASVAMTKYPPGIHCPFRHRHEWQRDGGGTWNNGCDGEHFMELEPHALDELDAVPGERG